MSDKEIIDCPCCDNSGATVVSVTVYEHGCCRQPLSTGECCGDAVPVPVEGFELEECQWCHETKNSRFNLGDPAPADHT